MKSIVTLVSLLLVSVVFGQGALGDIVGEVYDVKGKQPASNAVVMTESNGSVLKVRTDYDGRFRLSGIEAGTHFVTIIYNGDTIPNLEAKVPMDGYASLGKINYVSTITEYGVINVVAEDKGRIKLEYGNLPTKEISAEDIVNSPAKFDIKGMLTAISTDVRMTEDGELVFRGARKGDMLYLMDGVKTSQIGSVPSASIARMKVYSGGLPAKYGDTLGGVVVMESKSYFDLYNAWKAEEIRSGRQ